MAEKITVFDLEDGKVDIDTLEDIVNLQEPTTETRLSGPVRTWFGVQQDLQTQADMVMDEVENNAAIVLAGLGYLPPVPYTAGIEITNSRQTVEFDGNVYSALQEAIPFTTSGTFESGNFRLLAGITSADLSAATGSALVGFQFPGITTATLRNQSDINQDELNVRDAGVTMNGATDDTVAVNAAIAAAKAANIPLFWGRGTAKCDGNLVDFFDVQHVGSATIRRGADTWYITPKGAKRNTIHVGSGAAAGNDGLSSSSHVTAAEAFTSLSKIGEKSTDGFWTVRFAAGTITHEGVRFPALPIFKNRLLITGPDVPINTEPTAVWSGSDSTLVYALRSENNCAPAMFLDIRNIKFVDWNKATLSGAIVLWDAADIQITNVWVDNSPVGAWFWRSKVVVEGGTYSNCNTYGVAAAYNSTFDIGGLTNGRGVTFFNCEIGASASRSSIGYVKGCSFDGCAVDISCTRHGRVRPQKNHHKNWIRAAYDFDLLSVFTPDNAAGNPDTFEHTDSNAQVYTSTSGSVHSLIHRGSGRYVHLVSDANDVTISGQSGQSVLLSASNSSFLPFRMPAWAMKTDDIKLECEIFCSTLAGASGVLALNADGPGATPRLAIATIPAIASSRVYKITFTVFRVPGTSTLRYFSTVEGAGSTGGSIHAYGTGASPNSAAVSGFSESEKLFRLYWEPTSNIEARFFGMRTYVEV